MNVRLIFTLLSAVLWPITECSPKCLCMRLFHHYVKTTSYLLSLGQYRRAELWAQPAAAAWPPCQPSFGQVPGLCAGTAGYSWAQSYVHFFWGHLTDIILSLAPNHKK